MRMVALSVEGSADGSAEGSALGSAEGLALGSAESSALVSAEADSGLMRWSFAIFVHFLHASDAKYYMVAAVAGYLQLRSCCHHR
jgi:hypothetical protein